MESEDKFEYTYSAPTEEERREIEGIKKQFVPSDKTETKIEKLRRLNGLVTRPPRIAAAILSVFGVLTAGSGMTLVLEWNNMLWGIIVGILGIGIICVAYPVYKAVLKNRKKKYGREIIELSNELLNEPEKK